jgi:hypothetical protein
MKGQTLAWLIERESSDAAAKGIEQCRRASRLAEELVALASRNSPASAAGGGHASRWRRRPSNLVRASKAQRKFGVRA